MTFLEVDGARAVDKCPTVCDATKNIESRTSLKYANKWHGVWAIKGSDASF